MLLGVSRCPGRPWLLVAAEVTEWHHRPCQEPNEGRGVARGAREGQWSCCSQQGWCSTPGMEALGWHSGLSPRGQPVPTLRPGVGTSGRATGSSQELQNRLVSAPAGQGWVALPVSRGQHSPAAWAAARAMGWREKSLSHPSVPALEPCFSTRAR